MERLLQLVDPVIPNGTHAAPRRVGVSDTERLLELVKENSLAGLSSAICNLRSALSSRIRLLLFNPNVSELNWGAVVLEK